MISIIICSQSPSLSPAFKQNIEETIGVDYEIVHIDNSANTYNIFQAYNFGVSQAKGDILCFMHEDIKFYTHNWGTKVYNHMSNETVGALGLAGGHHVAKELDWRFYGFGYTNLIQSTSAIGPKPHRYQLFAHQPSSSGTAVQVAVLDGLWICIRRELFDVIRFDDVTFSDFHLYDSDICMQVNQAGKGVYVCQDVMLEHFSEGTFTEGFKDSLKLFFEKWDKVLPMTKGCTITPQQLAVQMERARGLYDKRFADDAIIVGLKKKFRENDIKKLSAKDFTDEELKIMEKSMFRCARYTMKNKRYHFDEALDVLKSYCHLFYAPRKTKLISKFIWYRFIKFKKLK